MGFGVGVVAFDQVFEIVVMALEVAVWVHRHKTTVLQEAWVDATACAWEVFWHTVNHVVLKPTKALVHSQVVHCRG